MHELQKLSNVMKKSRKTIKTEIKIYSSGIYPVTIFTDVLCRPTVNLTCFGVLMSVATKVLLELTPYILLYKLVYQCSEEILLSRKRWQTLFWIVDTYLQNCKAWNCFIALLSENYNAQTAAVERIFWRFSWKSMNQVKLLLREDTWMKNFKSLLCYKIRQIG
jgi:hypothetical protein